jgi:hypothetical protein
MGSFLPSVSHGSPAIGGRKGVVVPKSLWTEERDALLKRLCASGERLTAPEIAAKITQALGLERPLTRAAIVGRVNRLKRYGVAIRLPIERPGIDKIRNRVTPRLPDPPRQGRSSILHRPRPHLFEGPIRLPQTRQDLFPETGEPGVYLVNAGGGDCRFPISGEGLLLRVCAQPKADDTASYCEACAARAFNY